MTQLVSAVAAAALGVRPRQVSVNLADAEGRLDLTVRVPLRVLPPEWAAAADAGDEPNDPARTEPAQRQIRSRVAELSGSEIGRVTVRLTQARIHLPGRTP
ncbi:hypothetical protein [Cryobacterium arcticum]|uniref:Uncharacterized protein n=1 Tax=Cryobacterium arcticum TaxID=670052 RepID=A0A318A4P6_9MICO|nr:hypothetical protein [Cryobacterium arcticum]PXA72170.1 hypothetical protein CTB96_04535 [Cryobacterium arcticum]